MPVGHRTFADVVVPRSNYHPIGHVWTLVFDWPPKFAHGMHQGVQESEKVGIMLGFEAHK